LYANLCAAPQRVSHAKVDLLRGMPRLIYSPGTQKIKAIPYLNKRLQKKKKTLSTLQYFVKSFKSPGCQVLASTVTPLTDLLMISD